MKKYIVIVRDGVSCHDPNDERLINLDMYYQSPVVELNWEENRDKAMDEFDMRFRKFFAHFLNPNYELIEV